MFAFWCLKHLEEDKSSDNTHAEKHEEPQALYRDEQLIDIIDHLLDTMDKNKDGYVDYTEYRMNDGH